MAAALGCIADDFTGATDLANELQRQGLRALLALDAAPEASDARDADAIVVAMKIRSVPAAEARQQARAACMALRNLGCGHIYFKYCSTFDSTAQGNIGPVIDELMDCCGSGFTISTPSFPRTGRTVYKGHLFVNDALLSDTHMRAHPLTPMTESNLVKHLQAQTHRLIGLIDRDDVKRGKDEIIAAFKATSANGLECCIVDAIDDEDLVAIGAAAVERLAFTSGASGLGYGLARALAQQNERNDADAMPDVGGYAVALAGSCSKATLGQIERFKQNRPAFRLDIDALLSGRDVIAEALDWAASNWQDGPVLLYSSAPPNELEAIQQRHGAAQAGERIEAAFAELARALIERGARRIIVAGGEVSGAVVKRLGVKAMRIGPEIDPGVPWTAPAHEPPIALALKSGNFGSDDFFMKAFGMTR